MGGRTGVATTGPGTRLPPAFRLFLAARCVSWTGQTVTLVALPILIFQRTGSPALTGLLATLEALPYLVLGLPAGALADRWDRRRVMVLTGLLSAAAMGSVPLADAAGVLTTGHVLLAALTVASLFVVGDAAGYGALPEIVGRERIGRATARMVSLSTVITLVGPAVAGVLVTTLGAAPALTVDAVAYLLSALLLLRVRWEQTPAGPPARVRDDVAEGLRWIWGCRPVRLLTLLGTGLSLSNGAVAGTLVVAGVQQLGLADDDSRLGLLFVAGSAGTLLASLVVERLQARFGAGTITMAALALNAAALLGWSQARSLPFGLVVLAVLQGAGTLAIVNGIVTRQTLAPARLQSRVNTTARMVAWGGAPLGAGVGGALASWQGTSISLLCCSAGVLGSLLVGALTGVRSLGTVAALAATTARDEPAPQGGRGAAASSPTTEPTAVPLPARDPPV